MHADWADDSNFLPDPAAPQLGPEDADKPVPASQRQRLEPAPRQHRCSSRLPVRARVESFTPDWRHALCVGLQPSDGCHHRDAPCPLLHTRVQCSLLQQAGHAAAEPPTRRGLQHGSAPAGAPAHADRLPVPGWQRLRRAEVSWPSLAVSNTLPCAQAQPVFMAPCSRMHTKICRPW